MDKITQQFNSDEIQLASKTDLTKSSLPSKYMMPSSALELHSNYWILHTNLLAFISSESVDPLQRFIKVVQYNLSIFDLYDNGKKPFNPILGEVFKCSIQELDSNTNLIAEEVSHHPPTMCLFIWNNEKQFSCTMNNTSKLQFRVTNITVNFDHFSDIHIQRYGEHYITTQIPSVEFGTLKWSMEFKGHLKLYCKATGYAADIEFFTKSLLSSKQNKISGTITKDGIKIYKIQGMWNAMMEITDLNGKTIFNWTRHKLFPTKLVVDNSQRNSSAQIWKNVIDAIKNNDWNTGDREKRRVEEEQRIRIKEMQAVGKSYQPNYFVFTQNGIWQFKR